MKTVFLETLYPGSVALDSIKADAQDAIIGLLRETERLILESGMARYMLKRHGAIAFVSDAA